jgi:hypothetical protein
MFGYMFAAKMRFLEALERVARWMIRPSEQYDAPATPRSLFAQIPVVLAEFCRRRTW